MSDEERYSRLIVNRIRNPLPEDHGELHHVYPKAVGGWDYENTVRLTKEEHKEAHRLLASIFKGDRKVLAAKYLMDNCFRWDGKHLSAKHKAAIGRANSGPHKPFSPEAKEKMRQSALRRWARYREAKAIADSNVKAIALSITPETA